MVDDRVTDGKRIAQLLASELTGLETGGLASVSVVDADRDVTPDESGPLAYRIAVDREPVGTVHVYPEYVEVRFADSDTGGGTRFPDGDVLTVRDGASVKQAVDVIHAAVS